MFYIRGAFLWLIELNEQNENAILIFLSDLIPLSEKTMSIRQLKTKTCKIMMRCLLYPDLVQYLLRPIIKNKKKKDKKCIDLRDVSGTESI